MTKKISLGTPDLRAERIAELKRLIPEIFDGEGNLNEKELEKLVDDKEQVAVDRFRFEWAEKSEAKRQAYESAVSTLLADKKVSKKFDETENLLIEGDNLEVLKLLNASCRKSIDCIYIDPPYNTGTDRIYKDDYSEDKSVYLEKIAATKNGINLIDLPATDGRRHSKWLNMIYPRLLLAREMLKETGVIFVSIDDNEQARLKLLMDEIFGEENLIAQIVVQTNPRGRSLDKHLAKTFEYIIFYTKNYNSASTYRVTKTEKAIAEYKKIDENGKKYRLLELRNRNPVFNRKTSPTLFFSIYVSLKTGAVSLSKTSEYSQEALPLNSRKEEGCWCWSRKKIENEKHLLVGKKASTGVWRIYRRDYLNEKSSLTKEKSLWTDSVLNHENGRESVANIFKTSGSEIPFGDYPKSVELIKKCLRVGSHDNDLVLDFFAGSGTTAQAVMELNKEDGGNRKFILVQIPEINGEGDYKNIFEVCLERVKRVSAEIAEEAPKIDTGYKVLRLARSCFNRVLLSIKPGDSDERKRQKLTDHLESAKKPLFADLEKEREQILLEIAIKNGFGINYKLETQKVFTENKIQLIRGADKEALICLDPELKEATIRTIPKEFKNTLFICIESALNTNSKMFISNTLGNNLHLCPNWI